MAPDAELDKTVRRLIYYYAEPDQLLEAVRQEHPDRSKKEILLACLSVLIDVFERHPNTLAAWQDVSFPARNKARGKSQPPVLKVGLSR